jgi:hypothetical protein
MFIFADDADEQIFADFRDQLFPVGLETLGACADLFKGGFIGGSSKPWNRSSRLQGKIG